jgi:hypothetical protein
MSSRPYESLSAAVVRSRVMASVPQRTSGFFASRDVHCTSICLQAGLAETVRRKTEFRARLYACLGRAGVV